MTHEEAVMKRLTVEELAEPSNRDQSLSAPTDESGKDRQAFVDFAATVPAPEVTVLAGDPYSEPAPVAEAPERCKYCNRVDCESEKHRDDARLLRMCRHAVQMERDFLVNRVGRVESALTAAERKAEGLRTDLEASERAIDAYRDQRERFSAAAADLRTKLAGSERKFVDLTAKSRSLIAEVRKVHGYALSGESAFAWRLFELELATGSVKNPPASTEPAGVEAGKADPTPTETEAPARFRIGQRVKVVGFESSKIPPSCVNQFACVLYMPDLQPDVPGCTVAMEQAIGDYSAGEQWWVDFSELEPTDPAPPKPGAVSCSKSGACIHPDGHWYPCSSEPDRPVMAAELVAALTMFCDLQVGPASQAVSPIKAMRKAIRMLDREGGGK